MPITINDVARKCKVSPMTISRVLNNTGPVKEATRQKVLKTVKQLNYTPLRKTNTNNGIGVKSIGLVVPIHNLGNSDFYNRFVVAGKTATETAGYTCVLYSEDEIIRKTTEAFHQGRHNIVCDGLIFFCPYGNWNQYLTVLKGWGISCVLIRRRTTVSGVATINNDDEEAVCRALEYLGQLGHTAIGYVGRIDPEIITNRYRVYKDFIRDRKLPFDSRFIYDSADFKTKRFHAWLGTITQLTPQPTAFFCYDDDLTSQFMAELQARGLRVPEDVSVIGHDDDDICLKVHPSLTTIMIDVIRMSELAFQIISGDMIKNDIGRMEFEVKNKLIVRESCRKF
jgi:DNA-binding LacI/PurR family transcriptional regulator